MCEATVATRDSVLRIRDGSPDSLPVKAEPVDIVRVKEAS